MRAEIDLASHTVHDHAGRSRHVVEQHPGDAIGKTAGELRCREHRAHARIGDLVGRFDSRGERVDKHRSAPFGRCERRDERR
jgi:hypothetical protein